MHIPEGFISPHLSIPAYAASLPLWLFSLKRYRRYVNNDVVRALPVIGSLTAFAFVIQSIMIPIPGGTSAHIVGSALIGIAYNPFVAFVSETLVLLIQGMVMGMGGITVLPVNAIAVGFVGPLVGHLVFRLLGRFNEKAALFIAGYTGIVVSALLVSVVLGIQHEISEKYFPLPFFVVFPAIMLPHLIFVGPLEGMYTLFTHSMLKRTKVLEAKY